MNRQDEASEHKNTSSARVHSDAVAALHIHPEGRAIAIQPRRVNVL